MKIDEEVRAISTNERGAGWSRFTVIKDLFGISTSNLEMLEPCLCIQIHNIRKYTPGNKRSTSPCCKQGGKWRKGGLMQRSIQTDYRTVNTHPGLLDKREMVPKAACSLIINNSHLLKNNSHFVTRDHSRHPNLVTLPGNGQWGAVIWSRYQGDQGRGEWSVTRGTRLGKRDNPVIGADDMALSVSRSVSRYAWDPDMITSEILINLLLGLLKVASCLVEIGLLEHSGSFWRRKR